jgi:ribosome-associated heat shock protein Hsp15
VSSATVERNETASGSQRLDKWLCFTRFCRSRSIAAALCAAGRVRMNGQVVIRASRMVRPGDVLTLTMAHQIRVVRVVGFASARRSAFEAAKLYRTLAA